MLVLTGNPRVVNGGMATTANTIRINRSTGDALAQAGGQWRVVPEPIVVIQNGDPLRLRLPMVRPIENER